MLKAETAYSTNAPRIVTAIQRAKEGSLRSAAFVIRDDAVRSIEYRKRNYPYSPPGTPPFSHNNPQWAKYAIRYFHDKKKDYAIVGWLLSKAGTIGHVHEFGGIEEGRKYPERPTIEPALQRGIEHFGDDWRGAISAGRT